jgi:hypothetical protein
MADYYKIHDGLIDQKTSDQIEMILFGDRFPWSYHANTNYTDNRTAHDDVPQFNHGFFRDGQTFSNLTGIPLELAKPFGLTLHDLFRAKANLVCWEKAPFRQPFHTDDDHPHFVILYYVNDSDGATVLRLPDGEEAEVTPKKGRILTFFGSLAHSASSPVETRYRAVININVKGDVPAERLGLSL